MAFSRYRRCTILNGTMLSTPKWKFVYSDDDVYEYEIKANDRFDKLAKEDLGDPQNWWILANINNIPFFFDLQKVETIYRIKNPVVFLDQI